MPRRDRDLAALPKAHLHLHLEGSMRPTTLEDLCGRNAIAVPEIRGFGSFAAFAETYVAACDVLRSAGDLERLIDEVVEDAARDGCTWIEPAFFPTRHADRLGPERDVWEMAVEFGRQASDRHGVGVGWLAALDRTRGAEDADRVTDVVLDLVGYGAPIVSFGLHNDEVGHPPEPFARQFARAAEAGLLRAPHAGELAGPASVAGALDALGADRIQHGVRAIEDESLVRRLAETGVALDVCPTSNLMLGVVDSLDTHPLSALLAAGVRCTLNADDPLLFGPGILEEYALARRELDLDDQQLADIARTSFEASAAPEDLIASGCAHIDAWLAPPAPPSVGGVVTRGRARRSG